MRARITEGALLAALTGLFMVAFSITTPSGFVYAILLAVPYGVMHATLWFLARRSDPYILPLTYFLYGLGSLLLFRISTDLFFRQVGWLAVSAAGFIVVIVILATRIDLSDYKYLIGSFGVGLLLLPAAFGVERGGARLWVSFGGISFQPSEMAKIALIVFLSAYLADKVEVLSARPRTGGFSLSGRHLAPLVATWVLSLLLLVFLRDLGFSLLVLVVFLLTVFVATGRASYVLVGSGLFVAGAMAAYSVFGHVKTRIDVWLNPWVDTSGSGYQIVQSLFAMAFGGVVGRGLGQGFPSLLPAVHTDLVYSLLAEEIGLAGTFALIAAFILFTARGMTLALAEREPFARLLIFSLTTALAFQAFLIIGGVTKLLPLTGLTLPFVSYGGSSLVSNTVTIALILGYAARREDRWIAA